MSSLFMEGSELHVKSIRLAFTGVEALSRIVVGLSKLVMLETATVADVVMLVQPAMLP